MRLALLAGGRGVRRTKSQRERGRHRRRLFATGGAPRLAAVLLAASLSLLLAIAPAARLDAQAAPRELSLLTWAEYFDPEVIAGFEKTYGARIKTTFFESDDVRDRMVQEVEATGFDLALINDVMVAPYARQGWIAAIDKVAVPNLRHIDPRWRNAYPMVEEFAVPYFWGTLGIAYRKDLLKQPVSSWMQLFRPEEALRGRIIMLYDVRDTLGMALRALGYSVNATDPDQLAQAAALLEKQRPYVHSYSYVSLSEESGIVTGEFWMAMIYNGDAYFLKKYNENIEFVVPLEGTNIWTDYLCVFASSRNKDLAFKFINYLNEPRNAAKLALYSHYATPNLAAQAYLPEEFLKDPTVYPPSQVIARSETYAPLPPQTMKARNAIFARLTR